jgi:gamma-glutamylcyclotransferase (GGCT)/AIG2-like uncharacterized protein YtfP
LRALQHSIVAAEHAIGGEVYAVDEATLAALDRLDDHPRFYRCTSLVLAGGANVETYLLTPSRSQAIPSSAREAGARAGKAAPLEDQDAR